MYSYISHNPQFLHAALLFKNFGNRFCAIVAYLVVALHSKRWDITTRAKMQDKPIEEKSHKEQLGHSVDFARSHPRAQRIAIRS
jgi:hypothetical protein